MAIRIKLRDGTEALVQASRDTLEAAIQKGQLLEIEQPDGRVVVVNAGEIQSFQEDPAAAKRLADRFQTAAG